MTNLRTIAELETLAKRVKENLEEFNRPFVIEFCGTPKSGKSTAVDTMARFFRRQGLKVLTVTERAEVCPIENKRDISFNIWTSCTTLLKMLEALDQKVHIVILDRGLLDAVVWMKLHNRWESGEDGANVLPHIKTIIDFLMLSNWREKLDMVVGLSVEPEIALKREFKDQLTQKPGSIMNKETLTAYNQVFHEVFEVERQTFRNSVLVDTTSMEPKEGVTEIVSKVLEAADRFLDDNVAVLNKNIVFRLFPRTNCIQDTGALQNFMKTAAERVQWMKRSEAEDNSGVVQILPVLVMRYAD